VSLTGEEGGGGADVNRNSRERLELLSLEQRRKRRRVLK